MALVMSGTEKRKRKEGKSLSGGGLQESLILFSRGVRELVRGGVGRDDSCFVKKKKKSKKTAIKATKD